MTPEERKRVLALVLSPGGPAPMSSTEFLRSFGSTDGVALGFGLLDEAAGRRDHVDTECALIVCSRFGFEARHLSLLEALAFAEWHRCHEDVASALDQLSSPSSVGALVHLTDWVPDYLAFDDARALAIKAIWGLGRIGNEAARDALEALARSDNRTIAQGACAQLERWSAG